MFEMLMKPKKAERRPWEMFFIGLVYAGLSVIMVNWIFGNDPVLSNYSGVLIVTFTVMFSIPFMYFIIKLEEKRIRPNSDSISLLKQHEHAIMAFLWLFVGFVVAYSFFYIIYDNPDSFKAQIETFCLINRPNNIADCAAQYGVTNPVSTTALVTGKERLFLIFTNNVFVLIFTLLFSLVFGAGVIFILAWNASVIAAAVGIFTRSELSALPRGLARYFIHGIPEIASYFIVALAGGLVSVSVIRHEVGTEKFWEVLQDSLNLIILAIVVLFAAALIEVYITPKMFGLY
jgi:uncharacterized membrane protein SpoIIM required for sporulation